LEEAVETEVFHSQPSARTEGNRTCSDCRGEQQGKSLLLTFKQTIQNSFLVWGNAKKNKIQNFARYQNFGFYFFAHASET